MESLVKQIRSCIASTKEKLSLRQLNNDYRLLIGTNIPYQTYGFRSLEELIQNTPEFRILRIGNEAYVEILDQGNSSHMSKMVKQQKSAKRKQHFPRNRAPPPQRKFRTTGTWRPETNYQPIRYHGPSRTRAVHHAQFVTRTPTRTATPSVSSRISVPVHSSYKQAGQNVPQNMPKEDKRPVEVTPKSNLNHVETLISNSLLNGSSFTHNGNKTATSNKYSTQSKPLPNNDDATTNPLMSTKKRLNMKISELNLDSGHSSPTSDTQLQSSILSSLSTPMLPSPPLYVTPAVLPNSFPSPGNEPTAFKRIPEFVRTNDPMADLKLLAELHKLGDVLVKITNIKQKRVKLYSCMIKVGKNTFSSYPKDFNDPHEATTFCCNEALDALIPKCKQKCLMLSSEKDILERIPPMIEKHQYGIFSTQLSHNYAFQYKEVLPDDWLQIIDASSCVRIEQIGDSYILYHCKPGDRGQQRSERGLIIPVSVPANTVKFGEDGKLLCVVTRVVAANEIWCEQIDTEESNHYLDMVDRMQVYYQEHEKQLVPEKIIKGAFYIAKFENNYFRVRLLEIKDDNLECFFIDSGEELVIQKTDLFKLTSLYATCQAQAFVCRLAGLEGLYEMSANSQCLASLFDRQVYLELASDLNDNDEDQFVLPVYMYDSSSGSCINESLIPMLTMEVATPILQPDITEVHISHIEDNGNVYVQVRSRGYKDFLNLKAQIESQFEVNPPTNFIKINKTNCQDKLFFKQHLGNWLRAMVIDWSPDGHHAQIYFVDEGTTGVVNTSDDKLYPLDKISDILNNYPHQAIRVRMALDKIPPNFKALAEKDLPIGHLVLLKCMGTRVDDIPVVKLYKRNDDGGLFCINESIALECELNNKKDEELKHKFKLLGGTDHVPSTGSLKSPLAKGLGSSKEFFKIKVAMAVSPYNFIVQPLDFEPQLNAMMERLQIKCEQHEYGRIKVEDIIPGNIYASKYDDDIWYRTNVIKVVNSGTSVSVFFCDFGYYQTLSVNNIVPLDSEFMELPYMALKAKLAGIKPTHSKWTMEDCERFKELVEKKVLFAKITDTEKDILYQYDKVLKLRLIDTSTEDDRLIDQELIKLGIAIEDETV